MKLQVSSLFKCPYGIRTLVEIQSKGSSKYGVLDEQTMVIFNVQSSIKELLDD